MRSTLRSTLGILGLLTLASLAQAQITYTGTTLGGPTFNRPVANGGDVPDTLSGNGTAVAYSARTFTVGTSGVYDLASVANYDNYTVLYQGGFDPDDPLTNALRANDDASSNAGVSGLLGQALTASQSYTLVTTGFFNADAGTFENSIRRQSVFQIGDTTNGPTFDPFDDGEENRYSVFSFTVSTSGLYSFQSVADDADTFDNFTALYDGAFDPNDVENNLLDGNDDNPEVGRSGFMGQQLVAGQTYDFVTFGYDQSQFGTFVNSYSGPGVLAAVPAPSGLLTALVGVVPGVIMLRRRRK